MSDPQPWVLVSTDPADRVVTGGPFLWDGTAPMTFPAGRAPMLLTAAITGGYTRPADAALVAERTLTQRAQRALERNAAYLAIASPTATQARDQVAALTRECSGLIRLLLRALDTTDGT